METKGILPETAPKKEAWKGATEAVVVAVAVVAADGIKVVTTATRSATLPETARTQLARVVETMVATVAVAVAVDQNATTVVSWDISRRNARMLNRGRSAIHAMALATFQGTALRLGKKRRRDPSATIVASMDIFREIAKKARVRRSTITVFTMGKAVMLTVMAWLGTAKKRSLLVEKWEETMHTKRLHQ